MTKIKRIFKVVCVVAIVLCMAIGVVACNQTGRYPIEEGVYYSQKNLADDEDLSVAKLMITAIDEATYNQAGGISVVEDKSPKRENKYYRIQLIVTADAVEDKEIIFDGLKRDASADPHEAWHYVNHDSTKYLWVMSSKNEIRYMVMVAQGDVVEYYFEFKKI